jgi:hypothetical protein
MSTTNQAVPASDISQNRCPEFNKIEFYKKIAEIVLKKLPWIARYDAPKWKTMDMILVLTYVWLRGFSIPNATERLNEKMFLILKQSKYIFKDDRASRLVPHQTSVNAWLAHFNLSLIDQITQAVFETMILRIRGKCPRRFHQIMVDFDFTYQGYWGSRRDDYIIGSKMVKGTKFIRHYHGVLIHATGISLFCAIDHTPKNQSKIPFMIRTIEWLLKLGFKISYAAMDREYYRYDILAAFKKLGVDVITPAKEYNQLKQVKQDYLEGKKGRIQEFTIGNKHKSGIITKYYKCWVVLFPKTKDRLITIKKDFKQNKITLDEASSRLFGLLTTRAPQWRADSYPASLQQYYRWRWGIETGFREVDEHPVIWRSDYDGERLFCEAGAYFMYNEWQLARFEDRRGWRLSFQMFRNEQIDLILGALTL